MLAKIRKSLVAGLGAGAAAYMQAVATGKLDTAGWATVVGAAVVVGFATWAVPNRREVTTIRT